jgi:hypothetical protein
MKGHIIGHIDKTAPAGHMFIDQVANDASIKIEQVDTAADFIGHSRQHRC